jgi:PKD repeat protein
VALQVLTVLLLASGFQTPLAQVSVDFSASPLSGSTPLEVQFVNLTTGGPVSSWNWDFGDGTFSLDEQPSHTYLTPGVYTVKLTAVLVPFELVSETKLDYITVDQGAPVPGFGASVTSGAVPLTVTFSNQTIGAADAWHWGFGDGGTSTDQHPVHIYTAPGIYDVSLTAFQGPDSATETKPGFIVAELDDLPLDFVASPTIGPAPLTVSFQLEPLGADIEALSWDFGDGSTSVELDSVHTYVEVGSYDVSVTVQVSAGQASTTKPSFITTLGFELQQPMISAEVFGGQAPMTVEFVNLVDDPLAQAYNWDFGDGSPPVHLLSNDPVIHMFTEGGVHSVVVSAQSGSYEVESAPYTVAVQPELAPAFSAPSTWPLAAAAERLELLDLTGDGAPEIVTLSSALDAIHVLENDGQAGFSGLAPTLVPEDAHDWSFGDLDADGARDVVLHVSGQPGGSLVSLLGDGAGGFELVGQTVGRVQDIGDLIEDGIPDVLSAPDITQSPEILAGVGDGTFQLPVVSNFEPLEEPILLSYRVGDVNGDGSLDVAEAGTYVGDFGGTSYLRFLFGDGTGQFEDPGPGLGSYGLFSNLGATGHLQCQDIDGDGIDDVAGAYYGSYAAEVRIPVLLPGSSEPGTLAVEGILESHFVGVGPIADAAFADLDGNGIGDAVWLMEDQIWWGHLVPGGVPQVLIMESVAGRIAVADLDDDGQPDLVTAAPGDAGVEVRLSTLPATGFVDVGGGLAGAAGVPSLQGQGLLEAGEQVTASLSGAAPLALTVVAVGLGEAGLPLKGGTLVPLPDWISIGPATSPSGTVHLRSLWPNGVLPGFKLWMQVWLVDAEAPQGWAASNGLRITVP